MRLPVLLSWPLVVPLAASGQVDAVGADGVHRVERGASVVLEFPRSHDSKLAVVIPGGEWLFLVDKTLKRPLMSEEAFRETSHIRVDTRTLKGSRFENGVEVPVHVFTVSGRYVFVTTDNLE